ncbi:MAG: queuosine precursor transporter [Chitinophagales bacterium]|nr:queuosine precursor transporter [Bacteroidota bacterium]MCB9256044.1 queuosine precursor transporter [Chitinophagales bacterium]
MQEQIRDEALDKKEKVFLILAGFFIASLVLTNLIAGRFFTLQLPILGIDWALSSGIIAYPITFLVTDVISEVFGEKRAKSLVLTGFIVSLFTVGIILISIQLPIWENSPVDSQSYTNVFGLAPGIVFGSMIAYLSAQYVDVQLFEFWRKLTKGKHLWLRNNGSTILSQLIDTSLVVIIALILYPKFSGSSEAITWAAALQIILGQYVFKAVIALFDTPFVYLGVYQLNKYLGQKSTN